MPGRSSAVLIGAVLGVVIFAISWSAASAGTIADPTQFFGVFYTTGSGQTTNLSDVYSTSDFGSGAAQFQAIFPPTNCAQTHVTYYRGDYPDQTSVRNGSSGTCILGLAIANFTPPGDGPYWTLFTNTTNDLAFYSTFTLTAGTWYGGINFGGLTLGATSTVFAPTGTSTPVISCTDGNFLNNSFCQMFAYLLAPSSASLSQYGTIIAVYQKKPPFGYFGAIKDEFDIFSSSTLATSTDFAALAAAGTLLPTIFTPADTALAVVVVVLLFFWIFHRIRNFDI